MTITDDIRLEHYRRFDKAKKSFERILYKVFLRALNKVSAEAIKNQSVNFGETDLLNAYIEAYYIVFKKHGRKPVMEVKREAPSINVGFFSELYRSKVRVYLQQTAGERITKVNENTKKEIRKIIADNKFTGARKTAAQLTRQIGTINKKRALVIARTESLTAMNHISHEVAKKQGVTSKAWLHTIGRSKNYREAHLAISGKPIGINSKFMVNGVLMDYPGDPNGGAENNCNCRCSVVYGYDNAVEPNYNNLWANFIAGLLVSEVVG